MPINYPTGPSLRLLVRKRHLCRQKKRGIVTSSPLASGLAIGTLIGLVVLCNSSVKVGLLGAISAFVVMVVLKILFWIGHTSTYLPTPEFVSC
jgi:hypothetical protein